MDKMISGTGQYEDCSFESETRKTVHHNQGDDIDGSTSNGTRTLTTADHGDITRYLVGVNNDIIQKLGIALGIVYGRLQDTKSPSFVNNMVALWLQRVDQVDKHGGPTWSTLEKAMRDKTVGMNGSANDVERERLKGPSAPLGYAGAFDKPNAERLVHTAGAKGADVVEATLAKIASLKVFPDDKGFMRRLAYVMSKDGESYAWENDGGIWQVSEYAFKDTKNDIGHVRLPRKYDSIREAFDIEWPLVERKDLEKPLYSALAARLFLSNIPEPISPAYALQEQASYWKRFYMRQHTGNDDIARFLKGVEKLESQSRQNL